MLMILQKKKYDLVFVGLGASNSLIISALYSSKILQHLKIAVIEPDPKSKNDKTYCFWATPEEVDSLQLSALTDHSWSKISCNLNEIIDISPLKYYHIPSISLYDHVKKILSHCNVEYYRENLKNLELIENENLIILNTKSSSFISSKIFDSRPPEWIENNKYQSFLWQSFLGWKIKTTQPIFDKNIFTMMDFEVDQSGATQFVYILPYSDNHALIELTRFGVKPLDHASARIQLEKYCREKEWDYVLQEEEQGIIPMSSMDIKPRSIHINHILTGAGAGKVKPTTGYAFKEMAKDAIQIAENFSINTYLNQKADLLRNRKFAFYDRLLLKILETKPEKGKLIFTSLFKNVDSRLVLKFLEQKTGFKEDISVMMSLPKGLFIKQAIKDVLSRLKPIFYYIFPLITTFLFLFLQFTGLHSVGLALLIVGLLAVGIPHGAMDHILEKEANKNIVTFIGSYLIKGLTMLLVWELSPITGLLFFIIYSAWHFGQADFIQWKLKSGSMSFLWGLGMILFILFTHVNETNYVISQILSDNRFSSSISNFSTPVVVVTFLFMLLSLIVKRNKWLFISIITILLTPFIPLLEAFGIYFICQHSLNGWLQIKVRLHKTNLQLWRHSLPFTIGAAILFFIFFINPNLFWEQQLGAFFIFLSCISFPHVMNMDHFYRR